MTGKKNNTAHPSEHVPVPDGFYHLWRSRGHRQATRMGVYGRCIRRESGDNGRRKPVLHRCREHPFTFQPT